MISETIKPYEDIDMISLEKDISLKIEKLKKISIIAKAFEILDNLPKYLKYHIKQHTEDVLHEAILFGIIDGLSEYDLERLSVAVAWHDTGYLISQYDNEEEAVRLFDDYINESGLVLEYVDDVKSMIMDTKIVTTEKGPEIILSNKASAYLLDADVSNFGRIDFNEKKDLFEQELKINLNDKDAKREFLKFTLVLMKNHKWHTKAAYKLRETQKLKNINDLEAQIAML